MTTPHPLSREDIVRRVVTHLQKDGRPSALPDEPSCYYRRPDTEDDTPPRCFIGIFIPDEAYRSRMENLSLSRILPSCPELYDSNADDPATLAFFVNLQSCHDEAVSCAQQDQSSTFQEYALNNLRKLARDYYLDISEEEFTLT